MITPNETISLGKFAFYRSMTHLVSAELSDKRDHLRFINGLKETFPVHVKTEVISTWYIRSTEADPNRIIGLLLPYVGKEDELYVASISESATAKGRIR